MSVTRARRLTAGEQRQQQYDAWAGAPVTNVWDATLGKLLEAAGCPVGLTVIPPKTVMAYANTFAGAEAAWGEAPSADDAFETSDRLVEAEIEPEKRYYCVPTPLVQFLALPKAGVFVFENFTPESFASVEALYDGENLVNHVDAMMKEHQRR